MRNNLKSVVTGFFCGVVVVFLFIIPSVHAVPFNITVSGDTSLSLSNASLNLTGGSINLADGQTAIVQVGTLSAVGGGGVVTDSTAFVLNFGVNSGGNSGLPLPASSASVNGTLFQFSIGTPDVLALVAFDANPSSMLFDFSFGTLTVTVGDASVRSSAAGSVPFNVSATYIADKPTIIPEPGTLTMLSFGLCILGFSRRKDAHFMKRSSIKM